MTETLTVTPRASSSATLASLAGPSPTSPVSKHGSKAFADDPPAAPSGDFIRYCLQAIQLFRRLCRLLQILCVLLREELFLPLASIRRRILRLLRPPDPPLVRPIVLLVLLL